MVKDVSNKTVIAVLVVFILVSVLALGLYMKAISKATPDVTYQNQAKGVATLTIAPPEGPPKTPAKTTDSVTGQAILVINKQP